MNDTRVHYVPPSTGLTAFNCPHCSALAKQFWFSVHAEQLEKDGVPLRIDPAGLDQLKLHHIEDKEERQRIRERAGRIATGLPFVEYQSRYRNYDVHNVHISRCFNCDKIAVWIFDSLAWSVVGAAPIANADLPADVRMDYEEAGTLLQLSPRGAAALLRLSIQKLCKELGEKGRNIDDDIAALVKKGLDPRVQQALDVVRVIGNNAVHPGQIDLRDDRATAEKLFGLVNLIAEIMISQPKHVADMYESLPQNARDAIKRRDGKL
ncbi:MAG: DUF4145 domain-containing protein [Sphingomonas sp.]|nr:DUF4145 domain-containing protein [Sphingomonas sp.]